jgi:putative nucleotidyltransferase with HDIG domain
VTASLLTGPVDRLVRSMRIVSDGDLHHRARVKSRDEIGYLAKTFNEMTASLEEKTAALEETYFASMETLARAIDARDRSTFGHSARVAAISMEIADAIGLTANDREALRRGALLHDIGKIGVEDRVLRKPGPLSETEADDMREHPRIGYDMLKGLRFLEPSLPNVLSHHERWDGAGYPMGLTGTAIPLSVRILAVADVFDALTSERPYRKGLGFEAATAAIRNGAGLQFDPEVVRAFLTRRVAIVERLLRMGKVEVTTVEPEAA